MKKLMLGAILLAALSGCCKGHISADAIDGLVRKVSDRHDAMLNGTLDPKSVSPEDKATYLRSTELLRQALREAQK